MTELPLMFIILGALFWAGLVADRLGAGTRLPRVTLLMGLGVIAGSSGFDLIPADIQDWYEGLSIAALSMVAFLLGNSLRWDALQKHGRAIVLISLSVVLVTVALVASVLWLVGVPASVAVVLGAIATATDPAATQDAIRQSGLRGAFADRLRGIVAIDDAWGLIAFSLALVVAQALTGDGFDISHLTTAAHEVLGAALLGIVVGFPAAWASGRLAPGEPMQTEALGIVFLTAGLALWLEVSFLIAVMVVGAVIANMARHHDRAFHEIENLQWPFMMLFFLLAGASLDLSALAGIGMIGAAYVVARIVARVIGGWIGGTLAGVPVSHRPLYGPALLAQAGVAVGMALVASRVVPDHSELILTLTIGTTVVFEFVGPLVALAVLRRANNADDPPSSVQK